MGTALTALQFGVILNTYNAWPAAPIGHFTIESFAIQTVELYCNQ